MVSLITCFTSIFKRSKSNDKQKALDSNEDSIISSLVLSHPVNPTHHPELNELANEYEQIIAFVNPKSGGQKGKIIYEKLKNCLLKENIFDLTLDGPSKGLELHRDSENLKVIACGGDGTVGWLLSTIDAIQFKTKPAVAILPLGTGNDLARTLGWGGGYANESIDEFLRKVLKGTIVQLDRWNISAQLIIKDNLKNEINEMAKDKLSLNVINNYFSIGADAKIAIDFHNAREKNPSAFSSQCINKIEYAKCDHVDRLDELRKLNCHSIVFLNIPSFAGGQKPWKNDLTQVQLYDDGKLEVVGFQTKDFMFLPMGGHGDRICQAKCIRIVTCDTLPMQIDGEPFYLKSSEISIELRNQSHMISNVL